jgi:hypothetical protein
MKMHAYVKNVFRTVTTLVIDLKEITKVLEGTAIVEISPG